MDVIKEETKEESDDSLEKDIQQCFSDDVVEPTRDQIIEEVYDAYQIDSSQRHQRVAPITPKHLNFSESEND